MVQYCEFCFHFVASVSGETLRSDASANISNEKVGAPIAKQPQNTSGLFDENRSVDRSGCATDSNVVKLKRIIGVPTFDAMEKLFIVSFSLISYTSITQKCGTCWR